MTEVHKRKQNKINSIKKVRHAVKGLTMNSSEMDIDRGIESAKKVLKESYQDA